MRLLVVNANTSQTVTEMVAVEARRHLPDGEIRAVTGTFGARVISTRTENAIAQHMLVTLMARHHQGCDAALIAVSFDTGLEAARELLPIPVVGMTESALLTGCMVAGRIGMVTFGARATPLYRELIDRYGLASRVLPIRAIDAGVLDVHEDPAARAIIVEAAGDLIGQGAEAVILAGAALAGLPRTLQPEVAVPLIDGIACGVRLAAALAALGLPKPRAGSLAPLPPRELVDVDPALRAMLED
jgi:allantoin racemase